MNLTIAIDFDETLTADPVLWLRFIDAARELGHRVICVTARRETDDNINVVGEYLRSHGIQKIPVYFTSLKSKTEYMASRGIKVDIWIDDDPKSCAIDRKVRQR